MWDTFAETTGVRTRIQAGLFEHITADTNR
jgi:hypothetical protein